MDSELESKYEHSGESENVNLYKELYTTDTIYMPPAEQGSTPLEVCVGCSWGKCRFCDFPRDKFCVNSMERIEHDLGMLAELQPESPRMFFLGENTFCLPAEQLLEIMALAKRYMPKLEAFAMYARIDDIARKSDEELRTLAQAGLNSLHVGVESGCDSILQDMNKGFTSADIRYQLLRLEPAGIFYHYTIILGLGGKSYSRFHAMETARLINQTHPMSIWCLKLHLYPGTPLHRDWKMGYFDMMSAVEILQEEHLMLQQITQANCVYADTTALDTYSLIGTLPEDKRELLDTMASLIRSTRVVPYRE